MSWRVAENGFDKGRTELSGSKFLLGNGYMGYRGTMEEYGSEQLVACVLSGIYDKAGDKWREPVNAPNGFFMRIYCRGVLLSTLSDSLRAHEQVLDIKRAVHTRESTFAIGDTEVKLTTERFLSLDNLHLMCMRSSIICNEDQELKIVTGLNDDIWDINGPHLEDYYTLSRDGIIMLGARTHELKHNVVAAEAADIPFGVEELVRGTDSRDNSGSNTVHSEGDGANSIMREITLSAKAGVVYTFTKYVSVYKDGDMVGSPEEAALESCRQALQAGYDKLLSSHTILWSKRWEMCDVQIEGDDEAQFALRYSIYHLLSIAPVHSDKVSIPARGLSGQVYKGAIFWDTEMFMLPFFIYTHPDIARNLMKYRCHTLDGARRKAAEYGYRGAFYAWESQETGDDACTYFNVTDVFTGRPMRTYFRDKQIHISADVVHGIWQYYRLTGDESILLEGGAEVILECARFFYSYAYLKPEKNRYELLDVTGPDEYHERVGNSAFTNRMVKQALEIAMSTLELLQDGYPSKYDELMARLEYKAEVENIWDMYNRLYVPEPDPDTLVIEQFDGYHRLEDISLKELKAGMLDKNEYLGGGCGLATTTKIIKQADVVLMLNLFKNQYPAEVKKANWEYYEPRTEHGSSLSPCVYAMLAADAGDTQWGYGYFMKTAAIDLTGESKQYVGPLYIGGTHPAANGGAWMAAVLGFGGVDCKDGVVHIRPRLPDKWQSLSFRLAVKGQRYKIHIRRNMVEVHSDAANTAKCTFNIKGDTVNA